MMPAGGAAAARTPVIVERMSETAFQTHAAASSHRQRRHFVTADSRQSWALSHLCTPASFSCFFTLQWPS
jgi:hypothetical protein